MITTNLFVPFAFIAMIIQILNQHYIEILFLSVSDDVIFTTVTTISIFIFGYLLNRLNEYRKEIKRLNELEKYFYTLFEQIKQPVNDQLQILKEMADDIADKKKNQFTCKENVNLDVTNLLRIPHLDLHKLFVVRKKGEVGKKTEYFTNLINTLNYIDSLKKNIILNYNVFFESFNRYSNKWTEACNSILRQYDNFRSIAKRNKIPLSTDDFLRDFDRIIFNWRQYEDSNNAYTTHEQFIIPLKGLCNRYEGDERAYNILQLVVAARSSFNSMDSTRNTYKNLYQEDAKNLKSKFESFGSAIIYFKGENDKSKIKKKHQL